MQLMSAIIFIKLVESATKLKRGVIMRVSAPIGKWIAKLYKDHDQFVDNLLEDYNLNHHFTTFYHAASLNEIKLCKQSFKFP
jgi:ribosomal protein S3